MAPAGLFFLLVGCAVSILLFLLVARSSRAVVRQTSAEVAVPEFQWRWGAVCAGLALASASLCAFSLFGVRIAGFPEWTPVMRLAYIALCVITGVGLAQQRRFGVIALAALLLFCPLSALSHPSYAAEGTSLFLLFVNWQYFKRRWPALRW